MLKVLAYFSISIELLNDKQILTMLRNFRAANQKYGITGFFLQREKFYFQVIEGEPSNVDQLWDNIQNDPRHAAVTKILEKAVEQRLFGNWTMAFKKDEKMLDEMERQSIGLSEPFNVKGKVLIEDEDILTSIQSFISMKEK